VAEPVAPDFLFPPVQQQGPSLPSILVDMFQTCADEDVFLLPKGWEGSKTDISIYDAEEILVRREPPKRGQEHVAEGGPNSLVQPLEVTDQMPTLEVQRLMAVMLHIVGNTKKTEAPEPLKLKAVRQFACVYRVEQDSTEDCSVCLEKMRSSQTAWRLPCMHQVHQTCARRYFGSRGVKPCCPLCRINICRHSDK